ncbi:MAG: hypothetical protein M3Z25_20815 [Actinomycetota bacterium]|nr:hypothetical protein [Actinomycetota bacterium]
MHQRVAEAQLLGLRVKVVQHRRAGRTRFSLVAGVVIERSGEQFFGCLGLSGVSFGATVLATVAA